MDSCGVMVRQRGMTTLLHLSVSRNCLPGFGINGLHEVRIMTDLPAEGWQSVQGDRWEGPESQYVHDVPSNFREVRVGQDEGGAG